MARIPRSKQIDEAVPGVYHCTSRCVRRAFLCGQDNATGQDYDHRRQWIQERMQFMASCFQIDILGFGLMGNHFHCLLRNRPDRVRLISDVEVAMRWWRLSADSRAKDGSIKKMTRRRLQRMLADRDTIREYRRRLSSISWFMSYLKQPIAVQANQQDGVTGRFWEGRFHSGKIDRLQQLLAAMVYIDLNPIRAGMAKTPEESRYTGVFERIRALHQRQKWAAGAKGRRQSSQRKSQDEAEEKLHEQIDDWLSPVPLDESHERPVDVASETTDSSPVTDLEAATAEAARWTATPRASDRGILPISLPKYLQLLDWTGRQLRRGQRGSIPQELPSILTRLGLSNAADWLAALKDYTERMLGRFSAPVNTASELDLCRNPNAPDAAWPAQAFL